MDVMSTPDFSRRDLLRSAAALPLVGLLPATLGAGQDKSAAASPPAPAAPASPRKTGRFAHLTDVHLQPELNSEAGLVACLEHVQKQPQKPDFVMTGGDNVMDVFDAKEGRAFQLAKLLRKTWSENCGLPVEHCLGNHDIFGWNKKKSGTTGNEANWGKLYATQTLQIPAPFRSFDRLGWRFLVLDSVQPKDDGYVAFCDDAQWNWLRNTLKATPKTTPICVVSHIPILSVCSVTYGRPRTLAERGKDTVIEAASQHTDCEELHELFKAHGGVKLCLSGHIHLVDRCDIDGISYICDGAVSGSWWKGPLQGIREGYGLIDLYDDGTFQHQYVPYGWKAS